MTSRYDDFAEYRQPNLELQDTEDDCFELLSAYIDGEASSVECQQVQQLLDSDPEIKKLYLQLLQLQGSMQNLAAPTTQDISPDLLSQQVFDKVERVNRQRKLLLWGSSIVFSAIVAAISGLVPSFNSPSLKLAESSIEETVSHSVNTSIGYAGKTPAPLSVMVAVTLNQPTVTIPKAAISAFPIEIDSE
ncbi:MAG: anti-sigma factor [Xenococcus sp. (in: cyanobacteria)]